MMTAYQQKLLERLSLNSPAETATMDRLFLELSQFAKAVTWRELKLLSAIEERDTLLREILDDVVITNVYDVSAKMGNRIRKVLEETP